MLTVAVNEYGKSPVMELLLGFCLGYFEVFGSFIALKAQYAVHTVLFNSQLVKPYLLLNDSTL